jgi:hypothetical protein
MAILALVGSACGVIGILKGTVDGIESVLILCAVLFWR